MTKLIIAAPTLARQNAEKDSTIGYILGSGVFIAAVVALFSVAGFSL
jgi:hypothetical protein